MTLLLALLLAFVVAVVVLVFILIVISEGGRFLDADRGGDSSFHLVVRLRVPYAMHTIVFHANDRHGRTAGLQRDDIAAPVSGSIIGLFLPGLLPGHSGRT